MKKIKKGLILALTLALTATVAFAACSKNNDDASSPNESTPIESPSESTPDESVPDGTPNDSSSEECEHVYDNACDADCNECGETRTPADHVYDNACDVDCNVCGETKAPADHVYDDACDADCNECGETRTPADHVYDNACDADCNECGETRTPADHVYDNACDADCNVCGETRTPADHVYVIDSSDETKDTVSCKECSAVDDTYVFNKVVSVERQELLLTDSNVAISLDGISEYASVKKIYVEKSTSVQVEGEWTTTKEEISLGTDISNLDFTVLANETQCHGEASIVVVVEDAKGEHTVSVPVTLVTKEIKELADWSALQTSTADGATYGYYVLKNNIAFTGNAYGNAAVMTSTTGGDYGFRGTLIGNGYTVSHSGSWWTNGLFGAIGSGAVIKDVTFTQSQSLNYAVNRFVFGRIVVGATFDNVTINLQNQTPVNGVTNTSTVYSPLTYDGFVNCTMKDVTVNVENSTVNSLFGGGENAYLGLKNTTFENCVVNMKAGAVVGELGHSGKPSEGTATVYTAAGLTVEGATVLEGITFEYNNILLEENQVIDLSQATYSISLGEAYADYTVKSITLDSYDLGMSLSALAIPDEIKADTAKHGVYNITVLAESEGKEKEFTVPVTLATKAISTMADLNATVTCTDATGNIYGYYVLTADVSDSEEGLTIIAGKQGWASTVAFRGTLDGRGHTVSMNTSKWGKLGLFGTMNGATVKNVNFVDAWNNNTAILAWAAYNVTISDVTIKINNGKTCEGTAGSTPIFANAFQGNSKLTNVTITTKVAMPVMFAATNTTYLTCSNVVINGDVTAFSTNEAAFPTTITVNKTAE